MIKDAFAKPNVLRASCSQKSEQDARNTIGCTGFYSLFLIFLLYLKRSIQLCLLSGKEESP
jgi:hypothetical protein